MFPHHAVKSDPPARGNSFRSVRTASSASPCNSEVTMTRFGFSPTSFRQIAEPTSPPPPRTKTVRPLMSISCFFHNHSSSVCKHFGHARSDLIRIVSHADDCIRTHPLGMFDHDLVCFLACSLAELLVD